jgi:V/A-type H+-transporting ATPase subunit D
MAVMNINPTRMELTNLKRKLITARRGHKLLKDKRDELMRRFLELVRENKELRRRVEAGIADANRHMSVARSVMSDKSLDVALMLPTQEMSLDITEKNVMSVMIPHFDTKLKTRTRGISIHTGSRSPPETSMWRLKHFRTFCPRCSASPRLKNPAN